MSDLIRRSEVMEMLTNIELSCTVIPITEAKLRLRDIPTAYDVEKVVEQLESVKALHEELSTSEKLSNSDKHMHTLLHGLCVKVIEIVRKGGAE